MPPPYETQKVVPHLPLSLALPRHTTKQVGSSALSILGLTGQRLGLGYQPGAMSICNNGQKTGVTVGSNPFVHVIL